MRQLVAEGNTFLLICYLDFGIKEQLLEEKINKVNNQTIRVEVCIKILSLEGI